MSRLTVAVFTCALVIAPRAWTATASNWSLYQPPMFRWSEDFSPACSVDNPSLWLNAKCIALSASHAAFVSLGAEYRLRIDDYDPINFGVNHSSRVSSTQQRVLAHADFHFNSDARFFAQLGYGSERGRPIERPGDNDRVDIAQAFLDYAFGSGGSPWRLRLGRQEVAIGRFVAIRDATNLRRTFDAARLDGHWGDTTVLVVAGESTRQQSKAFNDDLDPDDRLGTIVLTRLVARGLNADFILLEHENHLAVYQSGRGEEKRASVGARIYGARERWDMDAQSSYQFGRLDTAVGDRTISAWGAAFEGGATFKGAGVVSRVALRIDVASGDRNPTDGKLGTFDLPYPNLSYLSDAAFFAPRNAWDVQPFVTVPITPLWTVTLGAQFLWRYTEHDAVYSSANVPLFPARNSGNYVATQPYLRTTWRPIAPVALQGVIEQALVGEAARAAGGRNATYAMAMVTIDF